MGDIREATEETQERGGLTEQDEGNGMLESSHYFVFRTLNVFLFQDCQIRLKEVGEVLFKQDRVEGEDGFAGLSTTVDEESKGVVCETTFEIGG